MMKVQFCAAGEKFGEILLKNKNLNLELEKNFKTIRTFAQNLGGNVLKPKTQAYELRMWTPASLYCSPQSGNCILITVFEANDDSDDGIELS